MEKNMVIEAKREGLFDDQSGYTQSAIDSKIHHLKLLLKDGQISNAFYRSNINSLHKSLRNIREGE